MNIATRHKEAKQEQYWTALTSRETHGYRQQALLGLVRRHFVHPCEVIVDIGIGTDIVARVYRDELGAKRIIGVDYDLAKVVEMTQHAPDIEWRHADILDFKWSDGLVDLILLQDMLHEVYSFYGRQKGEIASEVDHALGLRFVKQALMNLAAVVKPGGGIAITDNILCESQGPVRVRCRSEAVVKAVKFFHSDYPSRKISLKWSSADTFFIDARDWCILLTQYNKIKVGDLARWQVERMEIHQYMTETEFREFFESIGFKCFFEIGTPRSALAEWQADFEVVEGMAELPPKRVTLLAIKTG